MAGTVLALADVSSRDLTRERSAELAPIVGKIRFLEGHWTEGPRSSLAVGQRPLGALHGAFPTWQRVIKSSLSRSVREWDPVFPH